MGRRLLIALNVLVSLQIAGCGTTYYLQAAAGQAEVLRSRKPFETVVSDPATAENVRQQLLVADSALVFGRVALGLPHTGSYEDYADLHRRYVVWNVFATPEFSVSPRAWCFPVAGCVVYRGYFKEARARQYAAHLVAEGDDTYVGGVPAYSTLGWFDDPLLNTMLDQPAPWLGGVIFHELAHQLLHVPGDSPFNEGFATFVEQQGTLEWLEFRRDRSGVCTYELQLRRRAEVNDILARLRSSLAGIFGGGLPPDQMRAAKFRAYAAAAAAYRELRGTWDGPPFFDGWFGADLNNAKLNAVVSYEGDVPAFRQLFREAGGDLTDFYARARELAALSPGKRRARLRALQQAAGSSGPTISESAAAGSGYRAGCS